ncbi:MFS transporter [Buchananella hordeovulneris]|uniref:MFS transporter n=1 Tax=Buchananella hordeovulneris TaxID=52770 RepID=A0A1Q5PY78_9ACTO|nr:MFS transporter [Buchananella hordeovulneris]OKL52554.1 hypothetical protein BSZ40_00015 [Buchananella hordeovulneris]
MASPAPTLPHSPAQSLWRERQYRWWFAADTASTLNGTILGFALPLVAFALTGSEARGALTDSIRMVFATLMLLPGGVLQDRFDRRTILLWHAATGVGLLGTAGFLVWADLLNWWGIVVLCVLLGARAGLGGTTTDVLLPSVVGKECLPRAMAINEGRDATVQTAGPPLGGVLLRVGTSAPFAAGAVLSVVTFLSAWRLPRYREAAAPQAGVRDMFGGLAFVARNRFLRVATLVAAPIFALLSAAALVAMLDLAGRGHSQTAIALLSTAMAAGTLAGALLAQPLLRRFTGGFLLFVQLGLIVAFLFAFAFTAGLWGRAALLLPVLLLTPAANGTFMGFMMAAVPGHMTGRFVAALGIVGTGQMALVTAAAGWALESYGYRPTVLTMGALCAAATVFLFLEGSLRHLPKPEGFADYARQVGLGEAADDPGSGPGAGG